MTLLYTLDAAEIQVASTTVVEAANRRPTIGVFDSGVGGLTVLRALLYQIPDANYLYFGDTARLPYGSKSASTVAHYAVGAIRHLQEQGAEFLVIACNTATALAFEEIRSAAKVKVVGVVEPGANAAASASRNHKAVVIGTAATVASHAYRRALEARNVSAREKACPLFVPLVEEGWIEHPVTEQVARIYLDEAFATEAPEDGAPGGAGIGGGSVAKTSDEDVREHVRRQPAAKASARKEAEGDDAACSADVLLLGCTHYPLLKPLLRRLVPSQIAIVDSAESTAQEVARELHIHPLPSSDKMERRAIPRLKFFATDSAEKFKKMGSRFLGYPVEDVLHVALKE